MKIPTKLSFACQNNLQLALFNTARLSVSDFKSTKL